MRLGMGLRISDFLRAGAAAVVKSTLVNNLVSYWPLNEQSGTRVDVVGANDLTDNNTVGAVNRGPQGTVASFVGANTEYLSGSAVATSGDFSVALWAKPATVGSAILLGVDSTNYWYVNNGVDGEKVSLWLNDSVSGAANTQSIAAANGAWHLIYVDYRASTKTGRISVNGGALEESTALTNGLKYGTAFTIGGNQYDDTFLGFACGAWSRVLTAPEVISLFNAGNGKKYADLTTAEKVGLVSYWNLDEQSGVRYDSHGTNHLTDNNTVGSVINAGDAMDGAAASFVAANTESLSHATATFPTSEADFSVSMWIKPTAASGAHTIINSGTGSGANEWLLSHGADFTLTVDGDSDTAGTCTTDWQHVVLTYVTATKVMTLYVDTVSVVSGTGTGTGAYKAANDLFLGVQGDGTTEPYGGQIDEVAFWSRALSTAEIADLYAAGAGFFYNTTTEDFE